MPIARHPRRAKHTDADAYCTSMLVVTKMTVMVFQVKELVEARVGHAELQPVIQCTQVLVVLVTKLLQRDWIRN